MSVLIESKPIKDVQDFGGVQVGSLYAALVGNDSQVSIDDMMRGDYSKRTFDVVVGAGVGALGMYRGDERFFGKEVGVKTGFDRDIVDKIYASIRSPEDFDTQVREYTP